jgi:dTMP kinase
MIAFASVSTLTTGLIAGGVLGLFAGFSYPSGLTLVQENSDEELRGRTLGSMHSAVRLALVAALAAAPALSKIVDGLVPGSFSLFGQQIDVQGTRAVLWAAGITIIVAAMVTSRAVSARWRGLRLSTPGIFLVFEGGEGTGKSTQIERLAAYLRSRGREVLVTREPGGSEIGRRVRALLLDPSLESMSPKTEALLYAADRAEHVEKKIRPALREGKFVISDRYVDSSLAYQGVARRLGIESVLDLSSWATDDLMPDLVFLLDVEAESGLRRAGASDRIELESLDFHELVHTAYHLLASRYPERFVIVDASRSADEVESDILKHVKPYLDRGDRGRVVSGRQ